MEKLKDLFAESRVRFIAVIGILIVALAVPITMRLVGQQQDLRQLAAGGKENGVECSSNSECKSSECRTATYYGITKKYCIPNTYYGEPVVPPEDQIRCTQEVKECPDGSYVGRDPDNNCQFETCPIPDISDPDPCAVAIDEKPNGCSCVTNSAYCKSGYCNPDTKKCDNPPSNDDEDNDSGASCRSQGQTCGVFSGGNCCSGLSCSGGTCKVPSGGDGDSGGGGSSQPVGGNTCSVSVSGEFWLDQNKDGQRHVIDDKDQNVGARIAAYQNGVKIKEIASHYLRNDYRLILSSSGTFDIYFYSSTFRPTTKHPVRLNAKCGASYTADFGLTREASNPFPTNYLTPTATPKPTSVPTRTPTSTPTGSQVSACGTSCDTNSSCANATDGCTICQRASGSRTAKCTAAPTPTTTTAPTDKVTTTPTTTPSASCGASCTSDSACAAATDGCSKCVQSSTRGGSTCQRNGITPTPSIGGSDVGVNLKLTLPGIGQLTGDNPNPNNPNRTARVVVYNSDNQEVADATGTTIFDGQSTYAGRLNLGSNFSAGFYYLKASFDNTLLSRIPGVIEVRKGEVSDASTTPLIPGDLDGNNILDVLDYNIFVGCYGDAQCQNKSLSDFNDDGEVSSVDYNILLRSFAIREGD